MIPAMTRLTPPEHALAELPRVEIRLSAFQKLAGFVGLMRHHEINGFGTVLRSGNRFSVTDVFLLPQTVSGAEAEIDDLAFNRFIGELVRRGGDPASIRFQWHSHVNMEAFFSGQDIATIRNYMNDFMISLVMNRRGEYACRIDLFLPFELTLETPLFVAMTPDAEILEGCRKDIKTYVRVRRSVLGVPLGSRRVRPETASDVSPAIPAEHLNHPMRTEDE